MAARIILSEYKHAIVIAVAVSVILFYVIPVDSLISFVSGQQGPPGPPRAPPGQYGQSKGCPPGQENKPGPPPPGLVGKCP
jgi:hypothetical protein